MLMVSIQISRIRAFVDFGIIYRVIFPVFICYLFVSALSLIKAINLAEGIFEWLKIFLSMTFLYVASLIIGSNKNSILILTKSVVVTGMILAVIGICQYYHIAFNTIPGNFVVYATMAHKNLFASALFLTSPFVLYGVLKFSGCWRVMSLASIAFICFSIAITKTRTVWLAMTLSMIIITLFVTYHHKKIKIFNRRRSFYFKTSLCLLVVFVSVILFAVLSHYTCAGKMSLSIFRAHHVRLERFVPFTTSISSLASLNERVMLWKKSLKMIKADPLFGVGLGQWKIVFPNYGEIERGRESDNGLNKVCTQRPHNDYLWVLSEAGFLGFICYLSIFVILIFYILSIIFKSKDTDKKVFSILMLFGVIGYMVLSSFSFPKERIFHTIFLMLITACILSIYHQSFPIQKKVTYSRVLTLNIPLLVILAFCMIFGYARLGSEVHAREALSAHKVKHWDRVISEIDKVDSWFYNMDPVSTPLFWYRGIANFSSNNIIEALEDFKMAYEAHPNHIHVLNNLGTCYALLKDYEKAVEYYQKVLAISPRFEGTRINLSVAYYRMGKYRQAYNSLLLCDQNAGRVAAYLIIIENKLRGVSDDKRFDHVAASRSDSSCENIRCSPIFQI